MSIEPMIAAAIAFTAVMLVGVRMKPSAQRSTVPAAPAAGIWIDSPDRIGIAWVLPESYRRTLALSGVAVPAMQLGFAGIHLLAMLLAAGAAAWLAVDADASIEGFAVLVGLAGWIGWRIPHSWLAIRRMQRRIEIESDFPVMLDLLQICMQGGMGLPAAWAAVTNNLESDDSALAEEMRRIDLEVGFGANWAASLEAASSRSQVGEFSALGSLLDQTERFGTEMARMIGVLCDSLRHDELQTLEERAHTASVKMLFPLAVLLLPGTLLMLVGPLLMMLFDSLAGVTTK